MTLKHAVQPVCLESIEGDDLFLSRQDAGQTIQGGWFWVFANETYQIFNC